MGFLSNLFLRPVTADKLPNNPDKLHDLAQKYWANDMFESAVLVLEKLHAMKIITGDERTWLADFYIRGKGCQQDPEKARDVLYGAFSTGYPFSLSDLSKAFWRTGIDYDKLIRCIAEGTAAFKHVNYSAYSFHLLRDLIHLCELGLKDAETREQKQAFFKKHCDEDWAARFYGYRLFHEYSPKGDDELEKFANVMNEESLVALRELDIVSPATPSHAFSSSLSDFRSQARKSTSYRAAFFRKYADADAAEKALRQEFMNLYHSVSAQEILDLLYAQEAAQRKAKLDAENARRAEEEQIYQQRLRTISGRLYLAERCHYRDDFQGAEAHLLAARAMRPENDGDLEAAVAVWAVLALNYAAQKKFDQALQYAVRFFDLYHDWFPQDQTWSKYRPGVLKLVPEDLYFTFDHYKHGPQHGQQHAANSYLSLVSRIFSRWYCAVLRERIKSGDLEAALDLAMHLFHNYPEESGDAAFWMVWCIRQNHIPALYFAATSYDRELKLSLQTKRMYLTCVAESDDPKYAESARETLAIMDLEAAEQRKLQQMAREFQESQRQAQVNAQMDAVRKKLDTAEWKLSFLLTGDASTMEERILRGELSDAQILGYNLLRSEIEHRARKAISNQLHA